MQIMFVIVFHLFIRRHDQIKNQKKKKERNCTIKKQTLNITCLFKPLQVKKEALSFFIFLFIYLLSQNSSRVHSHLISDHPKRCIHPCGCASLLGDTTFEDGCST